MATAIIVVVGLGRYFCYQTYLGLSLTPVSSSGAP
jgi:hypothetical protein